MLLLSPAKINLFFSLLYKRGDGYHEIETLMQAISLYDTISINVSLVDSFTSSDLSLPLGGSNLILKARDLFRKKTGWNTPLTIRLEKTIPIQAGLGGGSGNAATTLFGINALAGNLLNEDELSNLSAEIGSDIPFFFSSGTALCTGRGEKIERCEQKALKEFLLVKPHIGVSTIEAYKRAKIPEQKKRKSAFFSNDLEEGVFSYCPEMKGYKELLLSMGFDHVFMTGSGSAFVCIGEIDAAKLNEIARKIENSLLFIANPIQRKPLEWYSFADVPNLRVSTHEA